MSGRRGNRSGVDFSIVTAVGPDGTVEWQEAKLVPATANNTKVEAVTPERAQTAKLAANATFATPTGCVVPHVDIALDPAGVGTVECTRTDYLKMPATSHYTPKISFDEKGEIASIADRYHP